MCVFADSLKMSILYASCLVCTSLCILADLLKISIFYASGLAWTYVCVSKLTKDVNFAFFLFGLNMDLCV